MNVIDLMSECDTNNFNITVVNGNINISYTDIEPSDVFLNKIKKNKNEIINFLALLESKERLKKEADNLIFDLNDTVGKDELYFFHPYGGQVTCYLNIAQRLNGKYKVKGIRAADIYTERNFKGIAELAHYYASLLLTLKDIPKFNIGGYSSGGLLAYEVARIINERTGIKNKVILLDAYIRNISNIPYSIDRFRSVVEPYISIDWQSLNRISLEEGFKKIEDKLLSCEELIEVIEPNEIRKLIKHFKVYSEYIKSYLCESSENELHLIVAMDKNEDLKNIQLDDWSAVAEGGLMIETVTGNHITMLADENNNYLCQVIDSIL